jgi:hypothetical protein
VGDRRPVHPDVVVITKIQGLLPGERGGVVGDDGIGIPKTKNYVLDKTHCLLGADFSQGSCLDPLSEHVDRDKQVGQAPRRFLEGSQKIQAPHGQMTM